MDGLLLKISFDFLTLLEKKGLTVKNVKVKYLSRDTKLAGTKYVLYPALNNFYSANSDILTSRRYLCSAGPFPVVENIILINTNLPFKNEYEWRNVTDKRLLVKNIQLNNFANYDAEIQRYIKLMNEMFDTYVTNVNAAIKARLNVYVDPCYVDAGYVSPN